MGFTFNDQDSKGIASSMASMHELLEKDAKNAAYIKPYWIGDDVLSDGGTVPNRYIIDFGNMSLSEARSVPDLLEIVEQKVKPERENDNRTTRRDIWWRFAERSAGLYAAIAGNKRVLVTPQTAKYHCVTFLANGGVYDQQLIVFALKSTAALGLLQSTTHERWLSFCGGDRGDTRRYIPSDAFENYPFPERWSEAIDLSCAAARYYDARSAVIHEMGAGLTRAYNAIHDPRINSERVTTMRSEAEALDRAVLDLYKWHDISEKRLFAAEPDDPSVYRFTMAPEILDEVLTRLLALHNSRITDGIAGRVQSIVDEDRQAYLMECEV